MIKLYYSYNFSNVSIFCSSENYSCYSSRDIGSQKVVRPGQVRSGRVGSGRAESVNARDVHRAHI